MADILATIPTNTVIVKLDIEGYECKVYRVWSSMFTARVSLYLLTASGSPVGDPAGCQWQVHPLHLPGVGCGGEQQVQHMPGVQRVGADVL